MSADNERRMIPRSIDITRLINYKDLTYIILELQHLREKYGQKAYITVDDECYFVKSTTVKVYLNYETPQTDEERAEHQRKLDERAEYERLKAKFETNFEVKE